MRRQPLIAVVDDESLFREWLSEHLSAAGYAVQCADTGSAAEALVQEASPALVLLDLRLPDVEGLDLLARIREIDRDIVVVMVTAYGEIETAVQAVKAGAYDFMTKPLDVDDLLITIDKALETRRLRQEVAVFKEQHQWQFSSVEIVGRSAAMREIVRNVEKIAKTESATVLLQGETGTGKDLVARAIHARSNRRDRPFLEINCTAIPEHLLESEMFGHEKGAFTDARARKKGLAELADGGTLFLDEIGDMVTSAQVKLLRFLEDSRFKRLGGVTDIRVDVRVIAATNRDLRAAVSARAFRDDLYYRLKILPIQIPPLRERTEDIAPLAIYFVEKLAGELNRDPPTLSGAALETLEAYHWPGNARELHNVIERAIILEDTPEIRPEHLPAEIRQLPGAMQASSRVVQLPVEGVGMREVERDLIEQALRRCRGNVAQAARLLGLSRDTLRYRIKKFGLDDSREQGGPRQTL